MSRNRFLIDSFFLSGGVAVSQVMSLAALPIYSWLYTPEEFGALTLYISIISILMVFSTLRFEQAIVLPESKEDARNVLNAVLGISSVFSLVTLGLLLSGVLDALGYGGSFELYRYFVPMNILVGGVAAGFRYWFIREGKFHIVGLGVILSTGSSILITVLLGYFLPDEYRVLGLISGRVFQDVVFASFVLARYLLDNPRSGRIRPRLVYESIVGYRYLIGTLVSSHGISSLYLQLPKLAISFIYGNTALGYYGLAERMVGVPSMLVSNAIGEVYRQRSAKSWNEVGSFVDNYLSTIKYMLLLGIPVYVVAFLFAPDLISYVLGASWSDSGRFAQILLVGGAVGFVSTAVDKGALIVGAYKYIFWWHSLKFVTKLVVVGVIYILGVSIETMIMSIVAVRIVFYVVDLYVEYVFSKGQSHGVTKRIADLQGVS